MTDAADRVPQTDDDMATAFGRGRFLALEDGDRVPEARQASRTDHARELLLELGADPERLAAVAATARTRTDRPGGPQAAELAELALGILEDAGALHDASARADVLDRIDEAADPDEAAYSPGPLDRHAPLRRALRKLGPVYWLRRTTARVTVQLIARSRAVGPDRTRTIVARNWAQDRQVGRVRYRACDRCRVGYIAAIFVDDDHQSRGIGSRLLARTRLIHPGHKWCTSRQYLSAQSFWELTARRTGAHYLVEDGDFGVCPHMRLPLPAHCRPNT